MNVGCGHSPGNRVYIQDSLIFFIVRLYSILQIMKPAYNPRLKKNIQAWMNSGNFEFNNSLFIIIKTILLIKK